MNADMALSRVVLPEPVPPEMTTLRRDLTIASRTSPLGGNAADLDQLREVDRDLGELADRQQRAVDRQRRHDGVDARTVGEAGIDERRGLVDAAADRADDLLDDPDQMPVVLEARAGPLEPALPLDEDVGMAVDQDVGDRRVLEQRLERAEAEQLVEHVLGQLLALGEVQRCALLSELLRDQVAHLGLDLLARQILERREIDEVEQAVVQLDLEVGVAIDIVVQRRGRLRQSQQARAVR